MKVGKTKITTTAHGKEETTVCHGTQKELMAERKKRLPEMTKKLEEFLVNYEGAGIAIVKNSVNEDGEYSSTEAIIIGVDEPHSNRHIVSALRDSADTMEKQTITHDEHPLDGVIAELEDLLKRMK